MPSGRLHIAIIPDGNRRWAKAHALHPWEGHRKATKNLQEILEYCRTDPAIGVLTVWGFSTENWKRDPETVKRLMEMLEEYLRDQRAYLHKEHIRLFHSGRRDHFSPTLRSLMEELLEETKTYSDFSLHLAVDYGGKDEIIRAWEKAQSSKLKAQSPQSSDPIRPLLDNPDLPDIDCIIRTAGEMRTSNFFLWQSTYAEWIFVKKYFPDFTVSDFKEALKEFRERTRRFGK
ncbi:MAG: polyprenyl diphosphate synthase [Candidatus Peregrinibacteria bacterium]